MTKILSDPQYQSLLVLWLAIAVDVLWRWPQSTHPLTLMRYLVQQMGRKVVPSRDYGPSQHYISGSLAALVLLAPLVICIAILVYMAQYPIFFEALILIALLDFGYQRQQYKKVLASVGRNKKSLAREMVKTMTARQCDSLSDIGIAKAAIESLWLKFLYLYCGVIFYYVVTGPIGALIYRLLLLTSWQWHYRTPRMVYFARPVRKLVYILTFPPALLGGLITLLISHPIKGFTAIKRSPLKDKTSLLLALLGGVLDIKLGGPAIYANKKYRYPRVGGEHNVKYSNMIAAKSTISYAMVAIASLASLALLMAAPV
ncbi:cobalamin biosynthesis protein [Alteromonas sp. KUL106]|uniref:cobalamin biosynthesis protein n=1 Tax=Alteromonas sp. KUL106 TaxID=2480799 RepID=UPI0012E46069|nr:cobalamin biosynthesis protein [Alteromonas sp. KUL106]GFD67165.1 adenosylcobinamide-phosphate synthase [Alteromonas sp. KUL106]GFD79871.1 adenosylcobinamide-phosphate synthase [Tenacibaculum sp. KUL118]